MKDKSWIIILIMGIALAISLGYSVVVSQRTANIGESTVTTTSIIEMTATTVTIKNTLTGSGNVEYKEKEETPSSENIEENQTQENEGEKEGGNNNTEEESIKAYQITLSIEDKDLKKAKTGEDVEISIKKDEGVLNYLGKVIKVNETTNNKSTLNIEISNPDDKIEENMLATCTVIVEKAENVVGLPIEAVQKNDKNEEFVDVVQADGTTKPIMIEKGISDDYYVEITSGLNVGDRVQIIKSTTTVVNENNSNMTSGK